MAIGSIVLALLFVKDSRREKDAPSLDLLGGVLATAALGTHLTAEHATQPDRPFAAVALDALKQALLTVVGRACSCAPAGMPRKSPPALLHVSVGPCR